MVKPIEEIAPEKREYILAMRQYFEKIVNDLMIWGNATIPQKLYKKLQAYCANRDIVGIHIAGEFMQNNVCGYRLRFDVEEYSNNI